MILSPLSPHFYLQNIPAVAMAFRQKNSSYGFFILYHRDTVRHEIQPGAASHL